MQVWVTDAQVRKLRAEMTKCESVGVAGVRAGMSRNTAAKYLNMDKLPSEMRSPRTWRTRKDPFEDDWPAIVRELAREPRLEAKTLLDDLLGKYPERFGPVALFDESDESGGAGAFDPSDGSDEADGS